MLDRLCVAAALALLGLLAGTGVAAAAGSPDLTAVAVGTFLAGLGTMAFLSLVYLIKVATGLEKPLRPEERETPEHR